MIDESKVSMEALRLPSGQFLVVDEGRIAQDLREKVPLLLCGQQVDLSRRPGDVASSVWQRSVRPRPLLVDEV